MELGRKPEVRGLTRWRLLEECMHTGEGQIVEGSQAAIPEKCGKTEAT